VVEKGCNNKRGESIEKGKAIPNALKGSFLGREKQGVSKFQRKGHQKPKKAAYNYQPTQRRNIIISSFLGVTSLARKTKISLTEGSMGRRHPRDFLGVI